MSQTSGTVQSLERALDIVEFLYSHGGKAALQEIASGLSLHKSTVHRLLATLKQRDYVYQDSGDLRYGLGLRFYALGALVKEQLPLTRILEPLARGLIEEYNEGVHVASLVPDALDYPQMTLIMKLNSKNSVLRFTPNTGFSTHCHCSASGKCLMAFAGEEYLSHYRGCRLHRFTQKTVASWPELERQLEEIRRQGYAVEDSETEVGLACIAVPILDARGTLIAAISVAGPSSRILAYPQQQLVARLKEVSAQAAALLG